MRPEVTIRPAVVSDAEALTALHLDCWDDAYTGLIPQQMLDDRRRDVASRIDGWRKIASKGGTLIASLADDPIGFASAGPVRDKDLDEGRDKKQSPEVELYALYLRKEHWGTGVGHALLERAIGDASCSLWVLEGNQRAATFYGRHGFVPDGNTEDEPEGRHIRMFRDLPQTGGETT